MNKRHISITKLDCTFKTVDKLIGDDLYELMSMRIFIFIKNRIFLWAPKFMWKWLWGLDFKLLIISY